MATYINVGRPLIERRAIRRVDDSFANWSIALPVAVSLAFIVSYIISSSIALPTDPSVREELPSATQRDVLPLESSAAFYNYNSTTYQAFPSESALTAEITKNN